MRKLNRLLALSSTALLCGFAGSLGASAQDAPAPEQAPAPEAAPPAEQAPQASESSLSEASQKNLADFSSCIADKKSADLLFVLDQSQSLIGYEGEPATDGSHFRVDATKDIVNQLANLGKDSRRGYQRQACRIRFRLLLRGWRVRWLDQCFRKRWCPGQGD